MWDMHGTGWGWWVFMTLGMLAFWVAVIYFVVWLVRGAPPARRDDSEDASGQSPLELLRRRLATGEISVDEYEERRQALEEEPRGPDVPVGA